MCVCVGITTITNHSRKISFIPFPFSAIMCVSSVFGVDYDITGPELSEMIINEEDFNVFCAHIHTHKPEKEKHCEYLNNHLTRKIFKRRKY